MNSDNTSLKSLSDIELLELYKKTDNSYCVGILFERYTNMVYLVCLKYFKDSELSKDASMQIFEKLLIDLKKHSITNFKSWLHSVAKNYCLMQLRKNKGIVELNEMDSALFTPVMEYRNFVHQEDDQLKEIKLSELENALSELNDEQKNCVELFYLKEKSYQEIVLLTGYSISNVKSYIQNGKRNLKNILIKKNAS